MIIFTMVACRSNETRNPLTGRCIKRNGDTARIPAVRYRLQTGRTFGGTKATGTRGFPLAVGSVRQVWNGTAHHTPGGKTRGSIMQKPSGELVFRSRRRAALANPAFLAARAPPFTSQGGWVSRRRR
jgi:hypothetical protein